MKNVENLTNFHPTLESLKVCTLMGSFWPKYTMFELKYYRVLLCYYTEGWTNIYRKTDCWLENDIRNLVDFHASSYKSENLHFDRLVLSKAYKVLYEKVQKNYVSWYRRMIQREAPSSIRHRSDVSFSSQLVHDVVDHAKTSSRRRNLYINKTDLFETSLQLLTFT